MTIRKKSVDPSAQIYGTTLTWTSATAEFIQGDTLDIASSMRGPARNLKVDVAAGASCTIRINSLNRRAPLMDDAKRLCLPIRNLGDEVTWTDTNAISYVLAAGESLELTDIPISSVEFVALSGTVVVTVR